jgi:hypothetical protein
MIFLGISEAERMPDRWAPRLASGG